MQVSYIGLLVHPVFAQADREARNPGQTQPHEIEIRLREKRDDQALEIWNSDSGILLYFPSTLTEDGLARARVARDGGRRFELTAAQQVELEQILAYELLLEEKFVVLPSVGAKEVGQRVRQEFEMRGWEVADNAQIFASGEMYDACVRDWAEEVRISLGIPKERRHLVEALSMTQERAAAIQRHGKERI